MTTSPVDKLRAFWDKRYADEAFAYGVEPNDFLVGVSPGFIPNGSVLCLADGEGRNGVWLARAGYAVTSIDVSARGMEKARRLADRYAVPLKTVVADLLSYDLGSENWDAIVSLFLHLPRGARSELHRRCVTALRPGGLLVFEAYGPGQAGRGTGGPPEPALLAAIEEVAQEFPECQVLHRFSGLREVREGALHNGMGEVTQFVVRKAG